MWSAGWSAFNPMSAERRLCMAPENQQAIDYDLLPRIEVSAPRLRLVRRNRISLDAYRFGSLGPCCTDRSLGGEIGRYRRSAFLTLEITTIRPTLLSIHAAVYNNVNIQRHLVSGSTLRNLRDEANAQWHDALAAA